MFFLYHFSLGLNRFRFIFFQLHLRYQIDDRSTGCFVKVSFGIAWLKSTKHQKRISKNILSNLADRLKVMFATVEKEYNGR